MVEITRFPGNLSPEDNKLIQAVLEHAKKRFSDITSIAAGLRTISGKIYTGVEIKMPTRSVSMCAERMAIFNAINKGDIDFDTMVGVRYDPNDDSYLVVNPCGECRQVEAYFSPMRNIINDHGTLIVKEIDELLPNVTI